MRVDIGVFAHNEAEGIAAMVRGLLAQDLSDVDARILVLANGCTDNTAAIARSSGAEVAELTNGGKSRTWNHFVHELSRREADVLIFVDADIEFPETDALLRLIRALQASPKLHVVNSRPVKNIVANADGLNWSDRLISLAAGTLNDWRKAICGQLYAMPAERARAHHLPIGLPVEDGFLRGMVLTDTLTRPEDLERIDGFDVWHIYASERSISQLIQHQVRIVIGSSINFAIFNTLRTAPENDRKQILLEAAEDPNWLRNIIQATFPRWPDGWVPWHFLVKRGLNLFRNPSQLITPKGLLLLVAGSAFDAIVYAIAQFRMARGVGAGHW